MPIIRLEMFAGRSIEQKRECKPEDVNILIDELPRDRWATGGELWSDKRSAR